MYKFIMFLSGFIIFNTAITTNTTTSIIGKWTNEDESRVLEFVQNSDIYEGIIRKADDAAVVGKKQITGLKQDKSGSYKGTLHIIKKNKDLPCTLKIVDNNTIEIEATYGFITKKQQWQRIK